MQDAVIWEQIRKLSPGLLWYSYTIIRGMLVVSLSAPDKIELIAVSCRLRLIWQRCHRLSYLRARSETCEIVQTERIHAASVVHIRSCSVVQVAGGTVNEVHISTSRS